MARDLPLGNGHFQVDFDLAYNLSDVYYDHAGQANHAAGRVSIFGAWVADGGLSWLGEGWEIERRYRPEALVTDVQAHSPALNLRLEINDAVPAEPNGLVRRVTVHNLLPEEREVRLFWHLDLSIVAQPYADTALYDPETKSVLIYKGRVWLLLSGYWAWPSTPSATRVALPMPTMAGWRGNLSPALGWMRSAGSRRGCRARVATSSTSGWSRRHGSRRRWPLTSRWWRASPGS
jgi:hypothetical protein